MKIKNFSLKRFLRLDIRWKLRRIGKKIGIHLYPNFFSFNGFKSIYSYFVFNLIFFEKVFKKKKLLINKIKLISTINDKKVNFIYCLPSSGSNFVRNFLSSYFELRYKIGNGIPKFDSHSDNRWIYSDSPLIWGDLFPNVEFDLLEKKYDNQFYTKEQFLNERFGVSRHPLKKVDLFKIKDTNPLIILREPHDWITSVYVKKSKDNFYKKFKIDGINKKIIRDSVLRYKKFNSFWIKTLKDFENDYLIINFEDLLTKSKESIMKILNFFKININQTKIDKALEVNSKEFTFIHNKIESAGTRFVEPSKKKEAMNLISKDIELEFNNHNIYHLYQEIKSLKRKFE